MKLKISLIIFFLVTLLVSCNQPSEDQYTLEVNLTGTEDIMVYLLQYGSDGWIRHDSAMTKKGIVTFTGEIGLPEMYYVRLGETRKYVEVFVEASDISLLVDFNSPDQAVVNGSESQKIFDEYNASMQEIEQLFQEVGMQMQQAMQKGDTALVAQLEEEFSELNERKKDFVKNFCLQHPNTAVSPYILYRNSYEYDYEDFEELNAALDPAIKKSMYAESLRERAAILKNVAVGQPYTDFTLNDPEGNPLPLSSVIGENYVLVDFWASWCQPCRRENPNIVAAYNAFHDKGFDVFGVSLDQSHSKWTAAIAQDGLIWNHVSDLKYWSSEAGKLYGVQSIPHSVLISPDGIIIAKNLRQEALHEKLAELLD
ncbi:MAG: TlpA disulfide reductase family protein [bacterium]